MGVAGLLGWGLGSSGFANTNQIPSACGVDARMLRYPDVSATQIAFVYAGDIWVAPKSGGEALRLSSPKGEESFLVFHRMARRSPSAAIMMATWTSTWSPPAAACPSA